LAAALIRTLACARVRLGLVGRDTLGQRLLRRRLGVLLVHGLEAVRLEPAQLAVIVELAGAGAR